MISDYPCEMCVSVFMRLHEKKRVGGRKGKRGGGRERWKIEENLCIMLQWGFLSSARDV